MEEDTGPKSQCVNCALLVDSVDADNMESLASHLTTFLIPGVFFLGIALRCYTIQIAQIFTQEKPKSNSGEYTAHKLGKKLIEQPLNQGLPCANSWNIWEVWLLPTQLRRPTCWWYNDDLNMRMWRMCDPHLLRRLMMPCCANWWQAASDSQLQKPQSVWATYIISTPFTKRTALKDDKGHFKFSLIYQILSLCQLMQIGSVSLRVVHQKLFPFAIELSCQLQCLNCKRVLAHFMLWS